MLIIDPYIYDMGLDNLTQSGNNYNFRCPLCGDSKKSVSKRRGWFKLSKNDSYYFVCHNCSEFYPFVIFLRLFFPPLYTRFKKDHIEETLNYRKNRQKKLNKISDFKEPCLEIISEESEDNTINLQIFRSAFDNFIDSDFTISKTKNTVVTLSKLDHKHHAYQYMKNRLIPINLFDDLYYTKSYMHLCNSICPGAFNINPRFDERIIIPFRDINGDLIGMQGRSLESDPGIRYLTWIFDKEHPKLFGLDKVNMSKRIWIVEGPIDSIFIPNCIAIGGADFNTEDLLQFTDNIKKDNFVFLYDPECRNYELIQTIEKRINEGFSVCILPESIRKYGKDINNFIENGLTIEEIMKIANNNVFNGLQAKIRLKLWTKIYKETPKWKKY